MTISPFEQSYFLNKFGNKSNYIPVFHEVLQNINIEKSENYVLYHGNLSVAENSNAALYLIDVYKNSEFTLKIASSHQNKKVDFEIKKYENIHFKKIESNLELKNILKKAHINALPTFQKTGIKLKLINALRQGKFVIANKEMIEGTGLEKLAEIANTKEEFLQKTSLLLCKKFNEKIVNERLLILEDFNPKKSAEKIIKLIFS
ncbi:MAG: hypothetical protein QM478_08295 [Flavobacteriaceae bacterium]